MTTSPKFWDVKRRQSQTEWKTEIRELLEAELESLGVVITSASSMSVGMGDFHFLLICQALNGAYIEVRASTKQGFSVSVELDEESFTWPTAPPSTYDRKNYTIQQLLDWLDTKLWKE